MEEEICIADGIEADSLIGKTVYFEAKRLVKIGDTAVRRSVERKGGANKPFCDLIPGTVVRAAPGRVAMEAAGGIYSRTMDDVILVKDLDGWMTEHPDMWVMMRGDQ